MLKKLAILVCSLASMAAAVTVTPITNPHVTFVDASGLPCVGCSLYTYAAGTTTPLATYVDSTGVSQNTNPIVLDAAGGAQIWIGTTAYKFVLINTLGVTIWTVDNVKGPLGTYCTLTGCTFTGAISGTSASFSGNVNSASQSISGASAGTYVRADATGFGYPAPFEALLPSSGTYPPNALSQSTPAAVTNGTYSFVGQMWNYGNGVLGTAYFQSTNAFSGFWNGPVQYRYSRDGGASWTSPVNLPFTCHFTTTGDSGGTGCINVSGGITPSGRVVLFTQSTFTDTHYIYSDNQGSTWSTEYSVNWPGGMTQCSMYGKIIPVDFNTLMQAGFCWNASIYESVAYFSTDNGASWGNMSVIASASQPLQPDEPSCNYFGASQIVCILRWNGSAKTGPLQVVSTNNGSTWTSQGYTNFDPTIAGGADVSYPFDLETFIDTDGKTSAALFYYQRFGSDGGLHLKVVLGDPATLVSSGVSGWVSTTLQTLYSDGGYGSTNSGYPTTVGNGLGYFLGWFFQVPAAGTRGYQYFYTYSGTGLVRPMTTLCSNGCSIYGQMILQNSLATPLNIIRYVTGSNGPIVAIGHTRGSVGAPTALSATDELGELDFTGYYNANFYNLAGISAWLDGTISGANALSRLTFNVSNLTGVFEAARINSNGSLLLGSAVDCSQLLCLSAAIGFNPAGVNSAIVTGTASGLYLNALSGNKVYFQTNGTTTGSVSSTGVIDAVGGFSVNNGASVGVTSATCTQWTLGICTHI